MNSRYDLLHALDRHLAPFDVGEEPFRFKDTRMTALVVEL